MDVSLTESLENLHDTALESFSFAICGCLTDCYRLCRNMLALNQENQIFLHRNSVVNKIGTVMRYVAKEIRSQPNEEALVLLRCGVQCIGNYCSGNSNNQQHIWEDFCDIFR